MSTALFEHSYYIGSYMSGILYGVELVMYFATLQQLYHRARKGLSWKFFFGYSTVLMILLTIDIAVNAVWGEDMWITHRDDEGGVPMYIATQLAGWCQAWGSSAAVGLVFMSDGLLIYRLFVIYGSNPLVIVLPCLAYIAAFILAVLELVESFSPGGFFFNHKAINFGTPYYALTVSLNLVVTILIVFRLYSMSRVVRESMGEEAAKLYTGVAAVLVESAAPYSLLGIMFLIPYARGSLYAIAFGQVWAKVTCLAPQLIILRVVSGKAWTRETFGHVKSSLGFKTERTTMGGISMSELAASKHAAEPTIADSENKSAISEV